jgi:hypothetical protein
MTTVLSAPSMGQESSSLLDEKAVEKRVQTEEVCAKRILDIQQTMFGQPSTSARVKFRRLVELFDTWEWLDLQEVLDKPEVVLAESRMTSNEIVSAHGQLVQW